MFELKGLDHIVLRTNRREKLLAFYCDILGCTVVQVQPKYRLTQLRAGKSMIDIVEVDHYSLDRENNVEHFCLQIAPFNFEKLKSYFEKHGIEIYRYGQRMGAQGIGYSFYLKDPQGNELELKEYCDKDK